MKNIAISLIILLSIFLTLNSCGSESEQISPASERGQLDAAALCSDSISLTNHELTAAILAVRSREWQMRSQGFDSDADAYIEAFRNYITEHNETLAKELF